MRAAVRSVTALSHGGAYTGKQKGIAMRMFAATGPDSSSARTAIPADILNRLAFGRPQRGPIQPALPATPAVDAAPMTKRDDLTDLDQRVRESGEW